MWYNKRNNEQCDEVEKEDCLMKKVFKFFAIIILLVIVFMLGVLYKENESVIWEKLSASGSASGVPAQDEESGSAEENEDNKIETLKDSYSYQTQGEVIEAMLKDKNEEYEMEVGVYETYDDMVEEYIKTFVSIKTDFYDVYLEKMRVNVGSGNIYDIDDNYMYIITCAHAMHDNNDDEIKSLYMRFVDDTTITIDGSNLFLRNDKKDVALIRIPLTYFTKETLQLVKTINFRNTFDVSIDEFSNNNLYSYRYRDYIYNVSYVENIDITSIYNHDGFKLIDNHIENGTSGGGIVDINGNYYTTMLNENHIFLSMLYYYQDLLIEAKK